MLTKNDISQIRIVVREEIQTETRTIKKDVKHIKNKLDETIKFFDGEVTHLRRRTDRIENHLDLPKLEPLEV